MDDVTDRKGAEISGEPELSPAEQVKRQGGGASNAGAPGAGGPPPTAPALARVERTIAQLEGSIAPLTKRGRQALEEARAELEALLALASQIAGLFEGLAIRRDSGREKLQKALSGWSAPGPFDEIAVATALRSAPADRVERVQRAVEAKSFLTASEMDFPLDPEHRTLARLAVFLGHGGIDGEMGPAEQQCANELEWLLEGDDQEHQEEGAELEAAGEPELTGEPGELEGDPQAGEPAEIDTELPGSPESDDQPGPGPEVSDQEVEGERPPETISLGVDTVGDLEDWAHTFRTLVGEFSELVAILSGRVADLHEAEGEGAPRPGWRQRLKEGLGKGQDEAP